MKTAMWTRVSAVALIALLGLTGAIVCRSKSTPTPTAEASAAAEAPSQLADLSTSLDAVRSAFNSRKHEARFLTLLSPG